MSLRILVVDDEDVVRGVICQVLSDDGYEVVEATNGEQALELFRADPFPLVLTDIYMGQMSGIDLLEAIRKVDEEALVIVMTSNATLETATSALRIGAHDYLTKPFEDIDLISAVVRRAAEKIELIASNRSLLDRLRRYAAELERLNDQLRERANRDGLTGLFNHRYFKESLDVAMNRATEAEKDMSMVFMDIDHFKHYNDTHGHLAGDTLLHRLGDILRECGGEQAVAARYGGEEFVLLLPDSTKEQAREVAESLRQLIADQPFEGRETQPLGHISMSLGVATYPEDGPNSTALIDRADNALYEAKNLGRNTVCCCTGTLA